MEIRSKSISEMLNENPSLTEKVNFDDLENPPVGVIDDGIEEAYRAYKSVCGENHGKGVMDLIKEDSYLSQEMTYEEFTSSITSGVDDSGLIEAYNAYLEIKNSNQSQEKTLERKNSDV